MAFSIRRTRIICSNIPPETLGPDHSTTMVTIEPVYFFVPFRSRLGMSACAASSRSFGAILRHIPEESFFMHKEMVFTMKHTRTVYFFTLLLAMTAVAGAQTCTTAVCTALGVSEAQVLAALPSPGNTNATVVVNIPLGSASWTTALNYTVPSAVTNLTIQGLTTIVWTGTAGTSTWAYATADLTTITDADSSSNPLMTITINGASTYFRMTGLTFSIGSDGSGKYNGELNFAGTSQKFRFDHIHFENTGGSSMVRVVGSLIGVMDHNVLDLSTTNSGTANGFQAFDPYTDTVGNGDGIFDAPTPWGSANAMYMEDNYFNGGASNDCAEGGFFVSRYNTFNDEYISVQTHGTKTPAGPGRGCRGFEAYHNYITGPTGSGTGSDAISVKGTTGLVWGNTMANGFYRLIAMGTDRNNGDETETNTPNGWGYCGSTVNSNGVGSPWDGNQPTIATGYPCLDGIGRGQDQEGMNGANFPSRLNSVTGTIAWPKQYLEPIYMWDNSIGSETYDRVSDRTSTNNRDYYYDCGSGNSTCTGGFTGAAGTGSGTLADRPPTCTAGPGGAYDASPTGSYGVAYFATDANGGRGELYVCSSTNTWTPIYEPYIYPHPLVSGSPTISPDPPSELSGTAVAH